MLCNALCISGIGKIHCQNAAFLRLSRRFRLFSGQRARHQGCRCLCAGRRGRCPAETGNPLRHRRIAIPLENQCQLFLCNRVVHSEKPVAVSADQPLPRRPDYRRAVPFSLICVRKIVISCYGGAAFHAVKHRYQLRTCQRPLRLKAGSGNAAHQFPFLAVLYRLRIPCSCIYIRKARIPVRSKRQNR